MQPGFGEEAGVEGDPEERRGGGPWVAAASGVIAGLSGVAAPTASAGVAIGALVLAGLSPVWAAWEVAQGPHVSARRGARLRAALPGWSVGAGVLFGAAALGLSAGGPSRAGLHIAASAAALLFLFALGCRGAGVAIAAVSRSPGVGAAGAALIGGVVFASPVLLAPWATAWSPAARSAVLRVSPLTAFPAALAGVDLLKGETLYRLCAYAQAQGYALPSSPTEAGIVGLGLAIPATLLCLVAAGRRRRRSA